MTTPAEHPDELLAEYVDGALGPEDRALAEAHLASCARCRDEVALADGARAALASLPELDAPPGATWTVVQRARAAWRRWGPLPTWAAAAAAAAALVGAVVLLGNVLQPASDTAGAPFVADAPAETGEGGPAEAADPEAADEPLGRAGLEAGYPAYREVDADRDPAAVRRQAERLAGEARSALEEGFPQPATSFYERFALTEVRDELAEALECVGRGAAPERSLVPFAVEASSFLGEPAYVAAFLQAESPAAPYTHLSVYVVDRASCSLRHFARQAL